MDQQIKIFSLTKTKFKSKNFESTQKLFGMLETGYLITIHPSLMILTLFKWDEKRISRKVYPLYKIDNTSIYTSLMWVDYNS